MFNRLLLYIIVILGFTSQLIASQASLEDSVLVESYAKGYAITADKNNLEGAEKNPASVAFESKKAFVFNANQSYDASIKQAFLGVGTTVFNRAKLSLTIPIQFVDEINEVALVNGAAIKMGEFSMLTIQPKVTITLPIFDFLDFGASATGLFDNAYNETAEGHGFDFGFRVHFDKISFGYALQQFAAEKLWSTGRKESIEPNANAGLKVSMLKNMDLLADVSKSKFQDSIYNLGSTLQVTSKLSISAGFRDVTNTQQFRFGSSLNLNSWRVHYAYGRHNVLSDSHKVGVTFEY